MKDNPLWWFRKIEEYLELSEEPQMIEYLKIATGETFIHTGGTAYWDFATQSLNAQWLIDSGVTHWRLIMKNHQVWEAIDE